MYRRPSMTTLAAILLMGSLPAAATAADGSADGKYSYRPYSQQNQAGSDAASSPANSTVPSAPIRRDDTASGDAYKGPSAPAYRGEARGAPEPGQIDNGDRGDAYERTARRPPPPAAGLPPTDAYSEARRIEATASAPDRSVPYSVREQDARRAAIEAWRSKAAERFGPEFSHWRIAEGRHVDCVRDHGDDAICTVSGVPARGDARTNSTANGDQD